MKLNFPVAQAKPFLMAVSRVRTLYTAWEWFSYKLERVHAGFTTTYSQSQVQGRHFPHPGQMSAVICLESYHPSSTLRYFKQKILQISGIQRTFCNSRKSSRILLIHVLISQTLHLEKSFIGEKKKTKYIFIMFWDASSHHNSDYWYRLYRARFLQRIWEG